MKAALDWEYMVSKDDNIRVLENTKTKDHDPPPNLVFSPKIVKIVTFDMDRTESYGSITSCVLELTGCTKNTLGQKKLSPQQNITLKALQHTIPFWHIFNGTEETKCVFEKLWRDKAITDGISNGNKQSQSKAFKRAKKLLLEDGHIREEDGLYFPMRQNHILPHVADKWTTLDMS